MYIGIHRGLGHVLAHTGMETNPLTSLLEGQFRIQGCKAHVVPTCYERER